MLVVLVDAIRVKGSKTTYCAVLRWGQKGERTWCGYGMYTALLRKSPMVDVCCGMPLQ